MYFFSQSSPGVGDLCRQLIKNLIRLRHDPSLHSVCRVVVPRRSWWHQWWLESTQVTDRGRVSHQRARLDACLCSIPGEHDMGVSYTEIRFIVVAKHPAATRPRAWSRLLSKSIRRVGSRPVGGTCCTFTRQ